MEYGLWNLHGGFWAGSNPCGGERSLYNTVSTGGGGAFHGCADSVSFSAAAAASPPYRSYRNQPEYVAMKPAVIPSRVIVNGSENASGHIGERPEQQSMTTVQSDMMAEHSSVESANSLHGQSGVSTASVSSTMSVNTVTQSINITSRSDDSSSHTTKKVKSPKHQRKTGSNRNESNGVNGTGPWNQLSGNVKTENTLQYLNQQYKPMYSMMFSRLSNKCLENVSDESDDDEEDDTEDDGAGYNNQSSMSTRSPQAGGRSGYECGECGLVADTRPGLKKHIAVCHPAPGPDPTQSIFSKISASCPMASCHFRTLERDELEAHVARHVAEGYSPTGKKRAGPVSLQRVRYEREEYRCQMCTYTCTIEKAFYKHLKLHTLGLGAASVKISCVICGKDRPTEVDMNKHMRKHRENRYFCCDICIFKTVQLKKLIQHRRMHTGEKPHLCPHCAYRSARRDNLRSHVRRVHKKENLYCDTFSPRGLAAPSPSTQEEPASPNPSQD